LRLSHVSDTGKRTNACAMDPAQCCGFSATLQSPVCMQKATFYSILKPRLAARSGDAIGAAVTSQFAERLKTRTESCNIKAYLRFPTATPKAAAFQHQPNTLKDQMTHTCARVVTQTNLHELELLHFGGVGVLHVLVQPLFQLPCCFPASANSWRHRPPASLQRT